MGRAGTDHRNPRFAGAVAASAPVAAAIGAAADVPSALESYASEESYGIAVGIGAFLALRFVIKQIWLDYHAMPPHAREPGESVDEVELDDMAGRFATTRALIRRAAGLTTRVQEIEHRLDEVEHKQDAGAGGSNG